MSIYDYTVKARKGQTLDLAELKGKVLLIVNTATGCGFTPQYEGLEKLYEKYHDQGLEILDFPCNQFGHQAPGDEGTTCKKPGDIKWNFTKFLVDRDGNVVKRFPPTSDPKDFDADVAALI